jgi:hypothetical protein
MNVPIIGVQQNTARLTQVTVGIHPSGNIALSIVRDGLDAHIAILTLVDAEQIVQHLTRAILDLREAVRLNGQVPS